MPPQQVEQRKQENPNDVDKVPVKSNHFNRTVIFGIEAAPQRKNQQVHQQSRADDHVHRVHAGHREVDPVEHFHIFHSGIYGVFHGLTGKQMQLVMIDWLTFLLHPRIKWIPGNQAARDQVILVFVVILDRFYAQERQAQDERQSQTEYLRTQLANLREVDGERHRKTAHDQHRRVDCAERDIQVVTAGRERRRILVPVKRVSQKHATKEHDLGHEKDPHAERACLTLLLHVFKMVLQRRVAVNVLRCCVSSHYSLNLPTTSVSSRGANS